MSSATADPPAHQQDAQRLRGPGRTPPTVSDSVLAAGALLVAGIVGLVLAVAAGVLGVRAVPSVLRTAAVGLGFFALCGYAPARLLVRGELATHRALFVLPIGAVVSSLSLAVLGLLHVPLAVSLAVLVSVSVLSVGWTVSVSRGERAMASTADPGDLASCDHRSALLRVLVPLLLAGMIALIALIPIFRAGYATVPGQNGDAILAVGSATLLQHAPPTATRLDLPINHIPLQWRSKYPIYYALAGISTLAGQDPIETFATISALVLALTALGFFLFARYVLRAPLWVGLAILFLVPLDRIAVYVVIHPYYNELWGQFALPFILLAGWHYLTAPSRSSAVLFAMFLLLGLLAYPLMIPFPATFLVVYGWAFYRRRAAAGRSPGWISGLRLPRVQRRAWMWVPAALVAVPAILVLGRGFVEKTSEAGAVMLPWTNLSGWHGPGLPYLPLPRFFGMPEAAGVAVLALLALWLAAGRGLSRIAPEPRRALAAMVIVAGVIGIYFRARHDGELFYFKDLAFLGPFVLMFALLALGVLVLDPRWRRRAAGIAGIVLALVVVPVGAGHEINTTTEQANKSILALRGWDQQLARGSSVRIDVQPSGYQLWVTYMFKDHRLCALDPLGGFFPHPPVCRKADYAISQYNQPRPADAIGPPLLGNAQFWLWRMNPRVPGPDVSSRRLIDDIANVTIG